MNWFVYFMQLSNNHIYVGSTNDVERRVGEHNAGKVVSTRSYLPAELQSFIAVKSEHHARELEKYFKTGSGKAVAKRRLIK
jgi:putative endonuclease